MKKIAAILLLTVGTAHAAQIVSASFSCRTWGREYEAAKVCAIKEAQIECGNKQVDRVQEWTLTSNCKKGDCFNNAYSEFECLSADVDVTACDSNLHCN